MIKSIPYTKDPEDRTTSRCNVQAESTSMRCHRPLGHGDKTQTVFKKEDDTEVVVEFNHRGLSGGRYYTW